MQLLVERSETYTIVLQPEPEGGFTVTCPALPEVVTYGETPDDARCQAREAIQALLESLAKDGHPAPPGDDGTLVPQSEQLRVRLPT